MSFASRLKQSAGIYRKTSAGDHFEPTVTWALLATVNCMTDTNVWNRQYIDGSGKVETIDLLMYCENTDITTADRVIVSSIKYEVLSADNPNSLGHHLEVLLKRLPAGTAMDIEEDEGD